MDRTFPDDLAALLAVVLFKLGQRLDDGDQGQAARPAGGEERQDIERRHGTQLIAEQHHAVLQLSIVVLCHSKQLPAQVLDHQTGQKVLGGVLLGQDQENGALLAGEGFRVDGAVETDDLLQLSVQEGVEAGEDRGHDRSHRLVEVFSAEPASRRAI